MIRYDLLRGICLAVKSSIFTVCLAIISSIKDRFDVVGGYAVFVSAGMVVLVLVYWVEVILLVEEGVEQEDRSDPIAELSLWAVWSMVGDVLLGEIVSVILFISLTLLWIDSDSFDILPSNACIGNV